MTCQLQTKNLDTHTVYTGFSLINSCRLAAAVL